MKLFSGTSNLPLSKEVSRLLKIPLSKCEIIRFGNSEVRVRIEENVKDETCVILQSTSNPTDTNLMELFFFCDALKRSEAKKVIGLIPYFGYARQNIQHRKGECVSANVVIRFIENIGFDEIYTFDLHDEATEGIFTIPFTNLTALNILSEKIKKYLKENNINLSSVVVVSPDQGGVERTRKFANYFYNKQKFSIAVVEKKRNQDTIHKVKSLDLYGNVKGKTVIMPDDVATSGETLINAANLALKKGAKQVFTAITHHDFTKNAPAKIQSSNILKFFTTNTIELKEKEKFPKLIESSVASVITKKLRNLR